LLELIKD